MADSFRRGLFADLTNRKSGPASATRSKKSSLGRAALHVAVSTTESTSYSILGSQESRVETGNANPDVLRQQNDVSQVRCAADSTSAPEATEATPSKKQISPTLELGFRTPENLLSGGVGEARSPIDGITKSEGRVKVYERRKTKYQYQHDLGYPRTCPQLGRERSTEIKRPRHQDWRFMQLHGALKKSRSKSSGTSTSLASSSRSETEKSYDSVSEKAYLEGRAYFAEVDAFELLEEEEEEEEVKEEKEKDSLIS